jgi:hypothetical protein
MFGIWSPAAGTNKEKLFEEQIEPAQAPQIQKGFWEKFAPKLLGKAVDLIAPGAGSIAEAGAESAQGGNIQVQTPTFRGPLSSDPVDTSTMTASYNPTGMEMDKNIYDDWIIQDFLNQGIVLPEEVNDIDRNGYKQIVPMGTGGISYG